MDNFIAVPQDADKCLYPIPASTLEAPIIGKSLPFQNASRKKSVGLVLAVTRNDMLDSLYFSFSVHSQVYICVNWLKSTMKSMKTYQSASGSPFVRIANGREISVNLIDLFKDQGCFLIAGGPSLKSMDLSPLTMPGIVSMGINNSPSIFRPNLWISVDNPSRFLESVWRDPRIMKFCGTGKWKQPIWDHDSWKEAGCPRNNDFYSKTLVQDCPNIYHIKRNNQFEPDKFLTEDTVNWGNHKDRGGGRSVMVAAIKILYVLGFRRIYLLGVDFKMTEKYAYSFKEERYKGAVNTNNSTYRKMFSYFTQLSPYFKQSGFKISNCTPGSDLTLFPYTKLDAAVEQELSNMPDTKTEETCNMYIPDR